MAHRWIVALLATATALTPIVAQANGGFGGRIVREVNEARSERRPADAPRVAPQPSVATPADAPRFQRNDRTRERGQRGPGAETRTPAPRADHNDAGNGDGRWDRRGDGGGFGRDIIRDAHRPNADRDDRDGRTNNDGRDWRGHDGNRHDRNDRYGRGDNRYDRHDRYDRNDNHQRWDRHWRNDRRYDWFGHRNLYRSQFQWPTYYSPYRNWGYHRLSIGFSLRPLFYSDQYWINNPWNYRLPDVYGPYRWIRYYDDALLVDVRSGEVVDVIDNFFW